jgi:SPP1 family predicted phage head-tail adaptor
MSVLAPRLRHRVTFQEQGASRDDDGVETIAWQTVALDSDTDLENVPAEVLTGPGKEVTASGARQSDIAARITVRWFAGLSAAWRIVWDGQTFNIATWETDITGRREYRIRCTAGMNDGQ